jgi:tetratricopeptide (TPR) repeat protein
VLFGPKAQLARDPALWPDQRHALVLRGGVSRPWGGLRRLVSWAIEELGLPWVEEVIAPHRASLCRVFRGLGVPAPPPPRLLSFLPSVPNVYRQTVGGAGALAGVLLPRCRAVAIPDVAALDLESLAAITFAWLGLPSSARPPLTIGHDPEAEPDDLHGRRAWRLADVELTHLLAQAGARPEPLPGPSAMMAETRLAPLPLAPFDDDLERRAWSGLVGGGGAEARALTLEAIRGSFDAYGYSGVLLLGETLITLDSKLSPAERAEVHTLIANAASALRPQGSDDELAAFLEHHLLAALGVETAPLARSLLYTRLALCAARRRQHMPEALTHAERAVEEARAVSAAAPESPWALAWAHHARSAALAGVERRADAAQQALLALDFATRADPDHPALPPAEVLAAQDYLLDRLAQLHGWEGDGTATAAWQHRMHEREARRPRGVRIGRLRVLRLAASDPSRVNEALRLAKESREEAERLSDIELLDRASATLGELLYRIGDTQGAYAAFARSLMLRRRLDNAERVLRGEISLALTAWRAGRHLESSLGWRRAIGLSAEGQLAERAELHVGLALALAAMERAEAVDAADAAIELALASRQGRIMQRVARLCGEVALVRRDTAQAAEAFERALQMVEGLPFDAAETVAVYAGRLAAGSATHGELDAALELLPSALQDGETAWQLKRLIDAWFFQPTARCSQEAWESLLIAARARVDLPAERLSALILLRG